LLLRVALVKASQSETTVAARRYRERCVRIPDSTPISVEPARRRSLVGAGSRSRAHLRLPLYTASTKIVAIAIKVMIQTVESISGELPGSGHR
jgi:hypothetical protein